MVARCKVKYMNLRLSITGILYNQFLIDRDSCSNIVGYFYVVAAGRIYQKNLAQILIYSLGHKSIKPHLLIGYLRYYTSALDLRQPCVMTKISYL